MSTLMSTVSPARFAPYSFSRLATHKQCARKFKYNYVDKVPVEYTDRTALLKGGAVHSIIEFYPNPSSHKLAGKYKHIVDNFIRTKLGEKYLSKSSIREFDFGLTPDLNICEYSSKDALFRGSVDYVCVVDNVLHLIDWKTGKYKEQNWQSYDQLMFYAIYFFKRYPAINKIKISYVYVEHEDHENSLELTRDNLSNYVSELMGLITNVETDEHYNRNPSKLCGYCDFNKHCSQDTL